MKKIAFILMAAILMAGGAVAGMSAPSYAQGYEYPPPPQDPYASPWVGPDTPWVYYNGDWFLDGTLYYFFGPEYGWAPYYAYAPGYIVRPDTWYGPRWLGWYQRQPQYWVSFHRQYPYWREHRQGQRYSQKFYEQHHHGHGGGWQKGFQGGHRPEGHKPGPDKVGPSEKHQQKQHEQKFQEHKQHEQKLQHKQQQEQHQGGGKEKEKRKEHEHQQ